METKFRLSSRQLLPILIITVILTWTFYKNGCLNSTWFHYSRSLDMIILLLLLVLLASYFLLPRCAACNSLIPQKYTSVLDGVLGNKQDMQLSCHCDYYYSYWFHNYFPFTSISCEWGPAFRSTRRTITHANLRLMRSWLPLWFRFNGLFSFCFCCSCYCCYRP